MHEYKNALHGNYSCYSLILNTWRRHWLSNDILMYTEFPFQFFWKSVCYMNIMRQSVYVCGKYVLYAV